MNLGRDAVGVFSSQSVVPLELGAAGTAVAFALDGSVTNLIRPDPSATFGKVGETYGGPVLASLAGGVFVAGRFVGDDRFRAMSYDLGCAMAVESAYTTAIKRITRRERPNGSNNQSFVSGHTSTAFALATVVEQHYGWRAGVPAYALAALIGVSRIKRASATSWAGPPSERSLA